MNFLKDAFVFQEIVKASAVVRVGSLCSYRFHFEPSNDYDNTATPCFLTT